MSIPVKLTVSFILVALCVSTVSTMVPQTEEDLIIESLKEDGDMLKDYAIATYHSSTGDRRTIHVSIPAHCAVMMGGDGTDMHVIRLLMDGETVHRIYLDNPLVSIVGDVTIEGDMMVSMVRTDEGVMVMT